MIFMLSFHLQQSGANENGDKIKQKNIELEKQLAELQSQNSIYSKNKQLKREIKEAKDFAKLATVAIEEEDYPMNFMIQDTINSKANTEFMFGKNEPIQQHYHQWIDKLSK